MRGELKMKCEHCQEDFPEDNSPEAKQNGEYLFHGLCLNCWTKATFGWSWYD